jgi:hypothetical protein
MELQSLCSWDEATYPVLPIQGLVKIVGLVMSIYLGYLPQLLYMFQQVFGIGSGVLLCMRTRPECVQESSLKCHGHVTEMS